MHASRLDETLSHAAAGAGVPGAQAVVLRDGDELWSGVYGLADIAAGTPVTDDTVFCLASVGKLLLATFILHRAERGLLDLDAPIASVLGREIPGTDVVTMRMLLAHTAGYPDVYESPGVQVLMPPEKPGETSDYDPDRPFTWSMLAPGYREPVEPGRHWAYSNGGYIVLTEVLARLLGGPAELMAAWAGFVASDARLGLGDGLLTPERSESARSRLAHGYCRQDGGPYADVNADHPAIGIPTDLYGLPFGDGMFAGTARGAGRFLDAVFVRGAFLGEPTLAQMTVTSAQAAADGPAEPGLDTYGLGTFRIPESGAAWQGHSGTYGGFSALAATRRADGVTLVVLTNGMTDDVQPARSIWRELAATCTA
ncbi:MAG TPA: serine hydrolase domain-containing protein [Nocardioides sp.]|uniref:serine hydrolase domain-containing protein n=1 Tax=Nocardioides sp. TaxID=35761 RepID=UPI002F3EE8EC